MILSEASTLSQAASQKHSLHHSFSVELAAKYGIPEAIIIHHFQYWIQFNANLKRNFFEGRYWSYQTLTEIAAHFDYFSFDQVKRILKKLEKKGVIIKGNFNKNKFDQTVWYAFKNQAEFLNENLDMAKSPNGTGEIAIPIPDTKPDTIPKKEVVKKAPTRFACRPAAPQITLNLEKRCFEGITPEDTKAWSEKFTGINVFSEIDQCIEWALTKKYSDFRKSILAWLRNSQQRNRTPYKPKTEEVENVPASVSEAELNKQTAQKWEAEFKKRSSITHTIEALHDRVSFIMPGDKSFEAVYNISNAEFIKKCENTIKYLKL